MKKDFMIKFGSTWTRRLALWMSLCYLINPIHRPINLFLHEVVAVFESPNGVLGHQNSFESYHHSHSTMEIKQGHNLIDLIGQFFQTSEEQDNSGDPFMEIIKLDKHLTASINSVDGEKTIIRVDNYRMTLPKLREGHLQKLEEPPQAS